MHSTTKYIDVLPKLVFNYNNAYHSGIKKIPADVDKNDEKVIELTNKKYNKAKAEEVKFNVGDTVRYILNKEQFTKGTLPRWSVPHKITDSTEHTYKLDNGKFYKYYLLQKIDDVQKLDKKQTEPTREQLRKENKVQRDFKRSGLDITNIVKEPRRIKPVNRLTL